MAYARRIQPLLKPERYQLTSDMAGIGMNFDAEPNREANVEDTIYFASIDGMEAGDLRTLSVLTTWMDIYSPWIIVDRLARLVVNTGSRRVLAYWASIARWKRHDSRFFRLAGLYRGRRINLLPSGTDFLISRNGEDPRFQAVSLRVPMKTLRQREMDVISPDRVQKKNLFIRYRIMMGPTYRSDTWAMLDLHRDLTPADLARRTYSSYPTAWHVKKDWETINGNQERGR
jgi:hypothetical protein